MKRRDFIKVSSTAGVLGVIGSRLNASANPYNAAADGFDLHPFIKEHPEAVFINITSVNEKTDSAAIYDSAYKLASEMFVKTSGGKPRYPCPVTIHRSSGKIRFSCLVPARTNVRFIALI